MKEKIKIKRTTAADSDFRSLIAHLDHELWNELNENQAMYDQYNKVADIETAIVIYFNGMPAASGCFKKYNEDTVEIKRMFVEKEYRRKGLSKTMLQELEKWAAELGFQYAVLETSIHFEAARTLYSNAGYRIIENYDQYKGLDESVCMKKKLAGPSEFKNLPGIEYFSFEEDFVEKNIRCIPMIVRFKMDKAGIKLKLSEWNRFAAEEKIGLAKRACTNDDEINKYREYLGGLIKEHTGNEATGLEIDKNPPWTDRNSIPGMLNEKLEGFGWKLAKDQWTNLTDLQRFALIKLCKDGHENKNFPRAMREFRLVSDEW